MLPCWVMTGLANIEQPPDDTQTIGDFFDAGPTNTVDAVGMDGQERAFAKILNKLKVGVEGGVATAVLPPAFGHFSESFKQDT